MRQHETCIPGYAALQILGWWASVCFHWSLPCLITVDTSLHDDLNEASVSRSQSNSLPHSAHAATPRVPYSAYLAVASGLFTTLSLTLPRRWCTGDAHVMSVALVILSRRSQFWNCMAVCLAGAIWLMMPFPHTYGIVRGTVTILSAITSSVTLSERWKLVRVLVAVASSLAWGSLECRSNLGALSPAFLIWAAMNWFYLAPGYILTFAVLVLVV